MKTRASKGFLGVTAAMGLVTIQACMPESAPADAEEVAALADERTEEARSALDSCGGIILRSCKAILNAQPEAMSGKYLIDPDGPVGVNPPFEVYCDMTSDGGGFTLLARTDQLREFSVQPWSNLIAQNYFGNSDIVTNSSVPSGYLSTSPFFALLRAEADIYFQDVRIIDGLNAYVQSLASPRTLRQIHGANGVEPLYQGGINTGVILLLGNAVHTSTVPCFYPDVSGQGCSAFYTGDTGSQTTAFYVGNLNACAGGPAPGNLPMALWGSLDCYGTNSGGGFAGFTYRRPINVNSNLGAYALGGYNSKNWSVYIR
jgi:Fibrinogen beta and gamma chains, C-terminal globular domain